MNEKDERTAGALPELRPDLEYIPVTADPGRIPMSGMHESGVSAAKEDPALVMVIDKISGLISGLTSLGMIYVLVRMLMMMKEGDGRCEEETYREEGGT